MAETKPPRNNAHCTLPDDPEQSTYRFIIVAAKRARQLQSGHRPVLPTSSKKPTVIAMEEVGSTRSEEHTSELQSHLNLVCRLLLEKKKSKKMSIRARETITIVEVEEH